MSLTAHQKDIMGQVIECLKAGHKRIIIKGSAGVGKTFLVKEFVEWYLVSNFFVKSRWATETVYITAPTNKALAILQSKMINMVDGTTTFKTIHSALKLRRDVNSRTGDVKFVPDYSEKNRPFEGCKLAVLDECSMLPSALLNLLDDYPFPIIFTGDDKQLNPVGEDSSPVFNRGYPTFELTEIIRQGEGNPIIDLSRNLDLIFKREPKLIDGLGYVYSNDRARIINNLAEVNGTDEMKYLAWTNAEVDSMNTQVRKKLYGETPARIEAKESLIFNAPLGDIFTNQEVKVEDVKIITEEVRIPTSFSRYDGTKPNVTDKIKMKVYRVNDEFNIIHEHSDSMYGVILTTLINNCKKFGWNWKGKFFFEEQFANVKYNHAISIHKSQGSTYSDAILNVGNANLNKNVEEKKRLFYTGITRAANVLLLNNV